MGHRAAWSRYPFPERLGDVWHDKDDGCGWHCLVMLTGGCLVLGHVCGLVLLNFFHFHFVGHVIPPTPNQPSASPPQKKSPGIPKQSKKFTHVL